MRIVWWINQRCVTHSHHFSHTNRIKSSCSLAQWHLACAMHYKHLTGRIFEIPWFLCNVYDARHVAFRFRQSAHVLFVLSTEHTYIKRNIYLVNYLNAISVKISLCFGKTIHIKMRAHPSTSYMIRWVLDECLFVASSFCCTHRYLKLRVRERFCVQRGEILRCTTWLSLSSTVKRCGHMYRKRGVLLKMGKKATQLS